MPMLSPWPTDWDQRQDWTADGRPDENKDNNCGPESVAECIKYLTGVELPADFIKDRMYGEEYVGMADINHLVQFMQKNEIPCEVHRGDAKTLLQPVVREAIDNGHPVIVLFFWKLEDPNSGHFCPVIGYDEGGCSRANVWGGVLEYMKWDEFEKWQKLGRAIVLKRKRAPEMGPGTLSDETDDLTSRFEGLRKEAQPYVERNLKRRAERALEQTGEIK